MNIGVDEFPTYRLANRNDVRVLKNYLNKINLYAGVGLKAVYDTSELKYLVFSRKGIFLRCPKLSDLKDWLRRAKKYLRKHAKVIK